MFYLCCSACWEISKTEQQKNIFIFLYNFFLILYKTKQTLQINKKNILYRHVIFIGIWWFVDGISKIVF